MVPSYRYRTPVLTGPWRGSQKEAEQDAVRAKQAQLDTSEPSGLKWIVPGQIEARDADAPPPPRSRH